MHKCSSKSQTQRELQRAQVPALSVVFGVCGVKPVTVSAGLPAKWRTAEAQREFIGLISLFYSPLPTV